jgi:dodecin
MTSARISANMAAPQQAEGGAIMPDHVYKSVELTGTSADGVEQAIQNAVSRASDTIRNVKWFEVVQVRGSIDNGKVNHWQVSMKLGFTLQD